MENLIAASRASHQFKAEMARFAQGMPADRIRLVRHAPRIKVLRLLTQLVIEEPELAVERVLIDGWSGCSDFRGTITVELENSSRTFRFRWDCSWRAEQEGWFDAFQLPDQIRAAQEFGWRCFQEWEDVSAASELAPRE